MTENLDPIPFRHVEHFSCAKCEKPFLGGRHFEKAGLAYCETHFLQLFGSVCYVCDKVSILQRICGPIFPSCSKF